MALGKGQRIVAYDKIIAIHSRLDNRISYALNVEKTSCGERILQTAINCCAVSAYNDMQATKARWGKTGGILGYHLIHSYSPGEISPECAHELGVEFARRLVGDRFEVVVGTHTDHEHIHCHIIFNSVSFVDGSRFRSDYAAYYGSIRGLSNEISRENGLSVIEPSGKGKHFAEWNAEKNGKPTVRGLIRQDIDTALKRSFTVQSFYAELEKQGYTIKRGTNVKHTAVRPPGGSRFIRLDSLGAGYTDEDIRRRLETARSGNDEAELLSPPIKRTYHVRRYGKCKRRKLHGFEALYVRYMYILGLRSASKRRKPVSFDIRREAARLDRYRRQFALLHKYRIENSAELSMLESALQSDIDALIMQRRELYSLKQRGNDVRAELERINLALRPLRRELRLCRQIEEEMPRIREQTDSALQRESIKTKTTERRPILWK